MHDEHRTRSNRPSAQGGLTMPDDKPIDWEARARKFALKLAGRARTDQRILDQALHAARADGWDEGHQAGIDDEAGNQRGLTGTAYTPNPYRTEGDQ